jgi:hypothetical protein
LSRLVTFVAAYAALGWLFEHETRTRGLVTPGGTPNLGVLALGAAYLTARITVRFGVPALVAVAAVRWFCDRWMVMRAPRAGEAREQAPP